MILDKKKYILDISLNKNNINFYRQDNMIFMKINNIYRINVKGLHIENNIIITKVILCNNFIYLPDIIYNTDKDLLTAIIKRDIYIEQLSQNKNTSKDLLRKKNLPFSCINNNIMNILNNI
tara:strand:- start:855 stop:1217 length:363 start_codon:yes stop_codon:yes gene_type:complete